MTNRTLHATIAAFQSLLKDYDALAVMNADLRDALEENEGTNPIDAKLAQKAIELVSRLQFLGGIDDIEKKVREIIAERDELILKVRPELREAGNGNRVTRRKRLARR
jgi:uncharacterized coiled-coil DUF342 family protein